MNLVHKAAAFSKIRKKKRQIKPLGREGCYFQNSVLFWEPKMQISEYILTWSDRDQHPAPSTQHSEVDLKGMEITMLWLTAKGQNKHLERSGLHYLNQHILNKPNLFHYQFPKAAWQLDSSFPSC